MNQTIRKFLIDQCVASRPVHYEVIGNMLNLNLALDFDRTILSNALGEISTFEFQNGRPLLSSIAIYKQTNDHGFGFYSLCEELKIGKAKELKERLYGFTQMEDCKKYWNNKFNYDNFYELSIPVYDDTNSPPFFTSTEIDFFKRWYNKIYDPDNSDHVKAKNYLLDTVWDKTRFWSNEIIQRLPEYETSNKRMWAKRDWANGERVSVFKPYTWARIYKKGDKIKDIFFTVGVDPENDSFVYKLDYFRESETQLTPVQKELCEKHIPSELKWNEIPLDEVKDYDWEKLIQTIVEFISKNSRHYDQIVSLVWGHQEPKEVFQNSLTLRKYPEGGLFKLPTPNPTFKGNKTDFIKKNLENKELGDSGEELVKELEIKVLLERGMSNYSNKVKFAEDGGL